MSIAKLHVNVIERYYNMAICYKVVTYTEARSFIVGIQWKMKLLMLRKILQHRKDSNWIFPLFMITCNKNKKNPIFISFHRIQRIKIVIRKHFLHTDIKKRSFDENFRIEHVHTYMLINRQYKEREGQKTCLRSIFWVFACNFEAPWEKKRTNSRGQLRECENSRGITIRHIWLLISSSFIRPDAAIFSHNDDEILHRTQIIRSFFIFFYIRVSSRSYAMMLNRDLTTSKVTVICLNLQYKCNDQRVCRNFTELA